MEDEFQQYLTKKAAPVADSGDEFSAYLAKKAAPPLAPAAEPSTADKMVAAARKGLHATGTLAGDALDAATAGYYRKARDFVGSKIAPDSTRELQQSEGQFNADHPFAEGMARGVGYLAPGGAPARLAEAASAGVKMGAEALPGIAGRLATSRPVVGALTGAAAGAGTGAVEDVARGMDAGDVASNAGRNALMGGLVGGGIGSVSAAASKGRVALRGQKNEMGRTIRGLDEAKASGVMNDPEFKALPKGAVGFNQAATNAEEQLATHNETLLKQARQQYGKDLADITHAHAERHHIVSETASTIDQLAAENTVNGVVGNDHLASALDKVSRMITRDTGVMDSAASRASGEYETISAPAVKVKDLLKVKKLVSDLADYGNPATPETRPYRILDKTIGRDLEGIDPRVGEMNARYAETMGQLEKSNEILYGSQNPDINRSVSKQRRARGLLGRVGDETQAATLAEKDVEALKELDPKYREIISKVEAKKVVERSRFGLPHVSRRIEHMPLAFAMQNATALGASVIDPALARLSGELAPQTSTAGNPLAAAWEQKRKRDAALAASLSGSVR